MRGFVALSCILVLGCGAGFAPAAPPATREEARLRAATVYISRCGTGWLADARHVVTVRHVADCLRAGSGPGWRASIWLADGRRLFAGPTRRARGRFADLAVIQLDDDAESPGLALGDPARLERGAVLRSVGNPRRHYFVPNTFRLVAQARLEQGLDGVLVVAGAAQRGESGAPLVAEDGAVVGVLFAVSPLGLAYAVPVKPYLVDLLAQL
jgi:S1-C subfamily serine protease